MKQVSLGSTEVIQSIIAQLANLNARVGVLEHVTVRGIASVTINSASHLIVTYTDGSTGDAGYIGGGGIAPTLGTLTLSGALQIGVATSGTISGATAGSSIAGNIPGITITELTYAGTPTGTAQTIANGLVETLAGATGSPKPSSVTVAAAGVGPSLGTLGLSSTAFTTGGATSVSISGKTAGSTVTATSSDGTLPSVSGTVLTGTFTAAGSPNITLTETLAGATNSPHSTVVGVTVTSGTAPGAIAFDPIVQRTGSSYAFTARRTTNLSNAETHTVTLAGSTAYPPGALASDFGGAFPSTTAAFAAGSTTATATFTSVPAAVQPE